MNRNLTRIVVVLDRSGSMTSVRESAVAGFNEFIRQQKQIAGEADVLLIQFDDQYEIVFDLPIAEVPLLDQDAFVPRGSTALLDAQGRTIAMLERQLASLPEARRHGKVCFVTLTDGQENASKLFNVTQIADMIRKYREQHGWEFIFLGANQDAVATAAKMNIPARSALTYSSASAEMALVMELASRQVGLFRQGDVPEFTEDDRDQALAEKRAG